MQNIRSLKQGDIIWLDHNPQAGREQAGRRPALIVSLTDFLRDTSGLAVICPITNTDNGYPLHIKLPDNCGTTGYVMCEQLKCLDLTIRNVEYKGNITDEESLQTVLDVVRGLLARDS